MNLGQLFIGLGIKGTEKTVGALSNVKKGLEETKSMSLEAKAALVGAAYALEQLFAKSGATGTGLTNFNALTGLSTQQLQQWQFAARQAGVAGEELTGSVKSVQGAMSNLLLGKGSPEGLALVANKVGFDVKKARDTFYVLQQLQKFAQSAPADVGNVALKSFGLSEGVIAAMRQGVFKPEMLSKAPVYNETQIKALDRANIGWMNLGNSIQMAIGRLNAAHGLTIVSGIQRVTTALIQLGEVFLKIAEKLKLFDLAQKAVGMLSAVISKAARALAELMQSDIGKEMAANFVSAADGASKLTATIGGLLEKFGALELLAKGLNLIFVGWDAIFSGLNRLLDAFVDPKKRPAFVKDTKPFLDWIGGSEPPSLEKPKPNQRNSEQASSEKSKNSFLDKIDKFASGILKTGDAYDKLVRPEGQSSDKMNVLQDVLRGKPGSVPTKPIEGGPPAFVPNPGPGPVSNSSTQQTVNISQNLNFQHEGRDSRETADAVKQANIQAYRQFFSQGQVS